MYIPAGFGHALKNTGDEVFEVVQTWDKGKLEEIDLDKWVRARPNNCDELHECPLRRHGGDIVARGAWLSRGEARAVA